MKNPLHIILNADSLIGRVVCAIIYVLAYDFMYENFIFYFFEYIGLDYLPMDWANLLLWLTFSVIPFLFYKGIKNISSIIVLLVYLFAYIPIIHGLYITYNIEPITTYSYSLVLCMLFVAYFSIPKDKSIFKTIEITPTIPLFYIEIITLVFSIILIGFRAQSMHFVNILTERDLLYSMREENFKEGQSMTALLYLQGWLGCAFYPFLMVVYLKTKSWIKLTLILFGNLFLFMIDMQKITFIIPFLMIGLYYFLNGRESKVYQRMHSSIMYFIVAISLILYLTSDNEIMFGLGAIILLRTVCVAGWLTQFYFHFFQQNPYTHFSHINIVNAITGEYPYDQPLGYTVAYGGQNANANFLLTDGYAAWGLFGIIIIGIIFYLLLHFINATNARYNMLSIFVVLVPTISSILNVSLFTTLLTKGFIILIIIMMCCDNPLLKKYEQEEDDDSNEEDNVEDKSLNKIANKMSAAKQ